MRADRVAIYIRWSTEDQGEGTTLEVQREACAAYMVSQGWQVNPSLLFVDDGVSGGTLDRPALTRLRSAVAGGEVDGVVVYKLDRLSRSVVDMVKLVMDEWEGRCFVKSAREPLDTVSQTGRLFFYQLMSFAEWERSVIRERTFAGKLRRAQEGKNPGITAAYGYRLGPAGLPVVEPAEAAVVQLIFKLYLSGLGCVQIARRLAELGHPSPAGRAWSSGQISRMLANPVYRGALVYGRQTTSRGRRCKSDRPHVVREGALPAVVDEATFAAVQALKARRPGVGRRSLGSGRSLSSKSLLTGLLRCPCGHAYCGNGGAGARSQYRYYYCAGAQNGACDAGRIRQEELDELVVGALLARLGAPAARARLLAAVAETAAQERREAETALVAARRDLERVGANAARLKGLLLEGRLTPEEYRELRAEADRQYAACQTRVAAATSRFERAAADAGGVPGQLDRLACWDQLTPQEQKQLVGCFIERITARRDKETGALACTIDWRWAPGAVTEADSAAGCE